MNLSIRHPSDILNVSNDRLPVNTIITSIKIKTLRNNFIDLSRVVSNNMRERTRMWPIFYPLPLRWPYLVYAKIRPALVSTYLPNLKCFEVVFWKQKFEKKVYAYSSCLYYYDNYSLVWKKSAKRCTSFLNTDPKCSISKRIIVYTYVGKLRKPKKKKKPGSCDLS